METSLHQRMKRMYAADESQIEQKVGRFIIDVIRGQELIEVQFSSLASINRKVQTLLKDHKVRVVKPLVTQKQLIRCAGKGERVVSRRRSPKRGQLLDIFDELIYFTRVFPHRNLVLEVPLIHIEEWSYPTPPSKKRRRRPPKKYTVEDQRLVEVVDTYEFRSSSDLIKLLPHKELPQPFDTAQLAEALQTKRWIAQKVAYCLRHMKAIKDVGKKGNAILYKLQTKRRRRATVA
jgi:hypothetical protein